MRETRTIGHRSPFFAGPSKRASQLGHQAIKAKILFKAFAHCLPHSFGSERVVLTDLMKFGYMDLNVYSLFMVSI